MSANAPVAPSESEQSAAAKDDGGREPSTKTPRPPPSWAAIGIFVLLLVAGLAYARAFLTPVLLAFLLALVFSPVRRTLCRLGLRDGFSATVIVGALTAALLTVGYLLATPVVGWMSRAPEIGQRLETRVHEIRTTLTSGAGEASLDEVVEGVKEAAAPGSDDERTVVVEGAGLTERLLALAPAAGVQTVLVLVLLLFVLASGDMFYEKIVHAIPRFRDKRRAVRAVHDIERTLSRYLLTITAINAGLGVAIGLAMWAFGMPDPLLFGVIGWLFNYVPYVGAIGGSALAVAVGLLTFDEISAALLPGLVYYALTAIEGQFITPYFVGRNLKLNTVVVFMTIAFWAWLWSVVGMLIAVPVLVTIRTICEAVPSLRPLADFLAARGAERETDGSGDADERGADGEAARSPTE